MFAGFQTSTEDSPDPDPKTYNIARKTLLVAVDYQCSTQLYFCTSRVFCLQRHPRKHPQFVYNMAVFAGILTIVANSATSRSPRQ
jgi:hypothetical protein